MTKTSSVNQQSIPGYLYFLKSPLFGDQYSSLQMSKGKNFATIFVLIFLYQEMHLRIVKKSWLMNGDQRKNLYRNLSIFVEKMIIWSKFLEDFLKIFKMNSRRIKSTFGTQIQTFKIHFIIKVTYQPVCNVFGLTIANDINNF